MNYRHAYHAGNFADCFKHALLVVLVDAFSRKTAPFFVLDTHAGAGHYDLEAATAQRTSEASMGIHLLLRNSSPALARYLGLVNELGLYPGSPTLIRAIMRERDRLACCELHPEDLKILRRQFRGDAQTYVHGRSGWEALGALLPPKEKRGLVFIDPPFEARDEFITLADALRCAYNRFSHGVFVAWYPIKQMAAVRLFHASLVSSGIRDIIAVEFRLGDTTIVNKLKGCGLIVINPPYQFDNQAKSIVEAIAEALGDSENRSRMAVVRLVDE